MNNLLFLESKDYTLRNCLLWGVCTQHFQESKKSFHSNLRGRAVVQLLMTTATILPVVSQIVSLAERLLYFFYHPPSLEEQKLASEVLKGKIIQNISSGYNYSIQLELPNKETVFWKQGTHLTNISEIAGSRLAHKLTKGLVPIAKLANYNGNEGVCQPFLTLNSKRFLLFKQNPNANFDNFTRNQKNQLFCHLIADRIISNWDTNASQYAIEDSTGNIINFDKGHAFKLFDLDGQGQEPIDQLALTENIWLTDETISEEESPGVKKWARLGSVFAKHIKEKKEAINPQDKVIKDFFSRCQNISKNEVEQCLSPLAQEIYPNRQEEFIEFIYKRIQSIKPKAYEYFNWKEEVQILHRLKIEISTISNKNPDPIYDKRSCNIFTFKT